MIVTPSHFPRISFSRLAAILAVLVLSLPAAAQALLYEADFENYTNDWLLESGSALIEGDGDLLLSSNGDINDRGQLKLQSWLTADRNEIRDLSFTFLTNAVVPPLTSRIFYYDGAGNPTGNERLLATREAGNFVVDGLSLNPGSDTVRFRLRLYTNDANASAALAGLVIQSLGNPVPEPGTALLMVLGLVGLGSVGRQR